MKKYLTFAILLELGRYDIVPARVLADKFEISTRSVYRYLDELESAGIPTFTRMGKNGGVGLKKTVALESLFLSENDKVFLRKVFSEVKLDEDKKHYFFERLALWNTL